MTLFLGWIEVERDGGEKEGKEDGDYYYRSGVNVFIQEPERSKKG